MGGVVRIDPAATAGQPQLVEGPALTRTSTVFEPGAGLSAGTWSSEPYTEYVPSYEADEVMVVLEGVITIRLEDGTETSYGPGEALAITQGTALTWIQEVPVHKIWVIRER